MVARPKSVTRDYQTTKFLQTVLNIKVSHSSGH